MNRRKLKRLEKELAELRRSPRKARELQSLAKKLGRRLKNRGKEPMWENEEFPQLFPLAIPNHKGRDVPVGTKNCILNLLEEGDLAAWHEKLSREPNVEDDGEDEDADESED